MREYLPDMNQYRKETTCRVAANEATITACKARMANETADVKVACKKKLADYKGEGKEQGGNLLKLLLTAIWIPLVGL